MGFPSRVLRAAPAKGREPEMQVEQLKRVLELHARYLKGQTGGRCANLQNMDLSGGMLDKVDLRTAQASGARLPDASVRLANLSKADFFGAHFERADLRRADLRGTDLRGAFFVETRLAGAVLEDADLRPGAIYDAGQGTIDNSSIFKDGQRVANLSEADMQDAKMARANMQDAVLYAANLKGADLSGVNFTNANLRNANLEGAKVTGTRFAGAQMTGANFRGVDLDTADLRGAYVLDARVDGKSHVEEAGLTGIDAQSETGRIIAEHQAWIDSRGKYGQPADLSGKSLANMTLRGMDFPAPRWWARCSTAATSPAPSSSLPCCRAPT